MIKRFDVLGKIEGVALIAVIFLLIVFGALGFAISAIIQNQGQVAGLQLTSSCADYNAAAAARFRAQFVADSAATVAATQTNTMTSISGALPSNCSTIISFSTGTYPALVIHGQAQ